MGCSESTDTGKPAPAPTRNQVMPIMEATAPARPEPDAARLRQQLQQEKAEHGRTLEAAAAAERQRLDDEAAVERRRLFEEAVAERARQDGEAVAERARQEEAAVAERQRQDAAAAAERRRQDDVAAAERRALYEEAVAALTSLRALAASGAAASPLAAPTPQRWEDSAAGKAEQLRQEREAAAAAAAAELQKHNAAASAAAAGAAAVAAAASAATAAAAAAASASEGQQQHKNGGGGAGAGAGRSKQEAEEDIERGWKAEDVLASINQKGAGLDELPESILDLHDGMPTVLRQAPMRFLKLDSVLSWPNIRVYEEVDKAAECVEVPYDTVDEAMWNSTIILSWRWNNVKPTEYQPGFSPMSDVQYAELSTVLRRAKAQGITYAWIDWCCVPQYCASPMVEVLRSKVFYARARAMTVIPTFHPIPNDGIVRLLLVKAARVIKKRAAAGSPRSAVVAARLESILSKEQVAGREYFSRVWTLAERMARYGRPERLCNWLSLEAWLGMLVDALLKSTDDRSASAIYKRILGRDAGESLDAILDPLEVAVKTGSMHVSEGLEERLAELFELAVGIWHTSQELAEAPTRTWLLSYLTEAHTGTYQAWADADRVWSVYSYFCWKQLDQRSDSGLLEALQDLVRVAGGSRKHLMGMASKLGLAKMIASADVDQELLAAAQADKLPALQEALDAGAYPDVLGKENCTPLWYAANKGNLAAVKALLTAGANPSIANVNGSTPIYTASAVGATAVVSMLLSAGAKKEPVGPGGLTPLHGACGNGHKEVVQLLLQAGLDKELKDNDGYTALHWTIIKGHQEPFRILMDAGSNINAQTKKGSSALYVAANGNQHEMLKALLTAGADKELLTLAGETPVHAACRGDKSEILKTLITAGSKFQIRNKEGMSPLHLASCGEDGAIKCVRVLVGAGAQKDINNPVTNMTPYKYAYSSEIKKLLKS